MTTFFLLLGAALCSMCLAINFGTETFYFVAFGTPEPWLEQAKQRSKMGLATWTLKEDGDIDVEFTGRNPDGTCTRVYLHGKKTDDPTRFTYNLEGVSPVNSFQFVNEPNAEYRLTRTYETRGDHAVPTVRLFASTQTPSYYAKEKMEALCADIGISPENIVYLPENDDCIL